MCYPNPPIPSTHIVTKWPKWYGVVCCLFSLFSLCPTVSLFLPCTLAFLLYISTFHNTRLKDGGALSSRIPRISNIYTDVFSYVLKYFQTNVYYYLFIYIWGPNWNSLLCVWLGQTINRRWWRYIYSMSLLDMCVCEVGIKSANHPSSHTIATRINHYVCIYISIRHTTCGLIGMVFMTCISFDDWKVANMLICLLLFSSSSTICALNLFPIFIPFFENVFILSTHHPIRPRHSSLPSIRCVCVTR